MKLLYYLSITLIINIWAQPRVTVITVIKDNDNCIEQFLTNAFNQSLFYESEILIIDNNSSGHEDLIIKPYLKAFTNIKYIRINAATSLSTLLNMGIRLAHAPLLTYCAIHDRRTIFSLEEAVKILEHQSQVNVVCSNYCTTSQLNAPWYDDEQNFTHVKLDMENLNKTQGNIGPQVVWRKSLHQRYDYFNEDFNELALTEMWCRLIERKCKFHKLEMVSGLCFKSAKPVCKKDSLRLAQMYAQSW